MCYIIFPFKFEGEYEDGYRTVMSGFSEEETVQKLIDFPGHGKLTWYSGVIDEDYVDGRLIR